MKPAASACIARVACELLYSTSKKSALHLVKKLEPASTACNETNRLSLHRSCGLKKSVSLSEQVLMFFANCTCNRGLTFRCLCLKFAPEQSLRRQCDWSSTGIEKSGGENSGHKTPWQTFCKISPLPLPQIWINGNGESLRQ